MQERDRPDAGAISAALAERIEALALQLLGPPTSPGRFEWRWRRKGSLAVHVAGPKRGRFFDNEAGVHGDALDLIRHGRGGSLADALRWAREWLGDAGAPRIPPAAERPPQGRPLAAPGPADTDEAGRIASALRIWGAAGALRGSPAASYLRGRKVEVAEMPESVAESLRFHPACPRGRAPDTSFLPALVALLRDIRSDAPCGVRRIFLEPDGAGGFRKMGGGSEKMALGRAGSAVAKLTPDAEVTHGLALAEGIEDALTLAAEGLAPVWAAGDAGIVRAFPVLPGVEALTILADRDPAGLGAAQACAARWRAEGGEVRVIPPRDGKDWNDVIRERAA